MTTEADSAAAFAAFIDSAWSDHADRPDAVADRLAGALHTIQAPAQIAPYARLVLHVLGEHLGQWQRGEDLLLALPTAPLAAGDAAARAVIARNVATLRFCSGAAGALDELAPEDRIVALGAACAALTGQHDYQRALAALTQALTLAESALAEPALTEPARADSTPASSSPAPPNPPAGAPAYRALAVAGNNLAAALEEKVDRDAAETAAMLTAAQAGLRYWKLAGTWLEEERAEYRLARSHLQAGAAAAAVLSAQRCVSVCEHNAAGAFETFFGCAVLALAQRAAGDRSGFVASRARALDLLAQVPPEEQHWCDAERRQLDD